MEIKSPITGNNLVEVVREIDTRLLVEGYKTIFGVNVERFFTNIKKISLCKCLDTGYKFYYPSIMGDGSFYAELQKFPWYYIPWKWEHEKAIKVIKNTDKVLEVGSASGGFLKILKERGNIVVGLETNLRAAHEAHLNGVTNYEEYLDVFVKRGIHDFDAVCFFQVMEHISNVREVMVDALSVLKKGGRLIISVPNNGAFLGEDCDNIFNMPPHHVGVWDKNSLTSLSKVFGIKLVSLAYEPLQSYHYGYYYHVKFGSKTRKYFGLVGRIINKIAVLVLTPFFWVASRWIKGHTIIAIYEK